MVAPRSLVCKHSILFGGGALLKKCLVYILANWYIFLTVKDLFGGVRSASGDKRGDNTIARRACSEAYPSTNTSTLQSMLTKSYDDCHSEYLPKSQHAGQQSALKTKTISSIRLVELCEILICCNCTPGPIPHVVFHIVPFVWKKYSSWSPCYQEYYKWVSFNIVQSIIFGGAILKKCLVYIFASWYIFLTVKDLFGSVQSASRDNTRRIYSEASPSTNTSTVQSMLTKGHDDCHSGYLPTSQHAQQSAIKTKMISPIRLVELFEILLLSCDCIPMPHVVFHTVPFVWKKYSPWSLYHKSVSINIVQSIIFGGAFLKKCLVYIFASWYIFLTVKDLFGGVHSASGDDTRRICSEASLGTITLTVKGHDDYHSEYLPKSQPNLNAQQSAIKTKTISSIRLVELFGIHLLCCDCALIVFHIVPFVWKKYSPWSLCYQEYRKWVSINIVQSIILSGTFLKESVVYILASWYIFLTVKDLFGSVWSASEDSTRHVYVCSEASLNTNASTIKGVQSMTKGHDDTHSEYLPKSRPYLNAQQSAIKTKAVSSIRLVELFGIHLLCCDCTQIPHVLFHIVPFVWNKCSPCYQEFKWVTINVVQSIIIVEAFLKRSLVDILESWYTFLTVKDLFNGVFSKSRNNTSCVSSDASTTIIVVYKSRNKGHDDYCSENLPKPQPNLTGARQSTLKTKKKIAIVELVEILILKSACCGCNPVLHVVCHAVSTIVPYLWTKYKIELHMCFTFSWQTHSKSVTAIIKHKPTGLHSEQNGDLHICNHPEAVNRGDRPLKKQSLQSNLTMQMHAELFISSDDGKSCNESTFGSATNCTAVNSSNYSHNTYRSQIAVGLQRSKLTGVESVADKATDKVQLSKQQTTLNNEPHSYREPRVPPNDHYKHHSRKDCEPSIKTWKREEHMHTQEHVASSGYSKPTYAVLVGRTVMVYDTSRFASLPNCSKFMVKERIKDSSGATKVKLALKSCEEKRYIHMTYCWSSNCKIFAFSIYFFCVS